MGTSQELTLTAQSVLLCAGTATRLRACPLRTASAVLCPALGSQFKRHVGNWSEGGEGPGHTACKELCWLSLGAGSWCQSAAPCSYRVLQTLLGWGRPVTRDSAHSLQLGSSRLDRRVMCHRDRGIPTLGDTWLGKAMALWMFPRQQLERLSRGTMQLGPALATGHQS